MYSFYTLLAVSIAFGVVTALIAKSKNRNPVAWLCIGFFLGLIGVVLIALLSAKSTDNKKPEAATVPIRESHSELASPADSPRSSEITKRIPTQPSLQWYYINTDLDCIGPLTINELRKQLIGNKLDGATYIWCEEFADWMQISEFQNASTLLDPDLI